MKTRTLATVAVVLLIIVAGIALLYAYRALLVPTSSPATSLIPTPTAVSAASVTAAAPSPARLAATAAPGLCSNPQMTTQSVIERYFELSTSKDPRAVSDCFAASWRARFVNRPSWDEVVTQWASAGPATGLQISSGDTVNGCDRYRVAAQMATGYPIGQSGSEFITIGPEGGTPRIFEVGTALVNAQIATTTCK